MSVFDKVDVSSFSSVEVEIYKFIVNNLEKVTFMRVRDIALHANVSSTSVFRFIKKLGFNSFPEFKIYLKEKLANDSENKPSISMNLTQRISDLTPKMFHPDIDYQLKQMAQKILNADCILFLGLGASGSIADYASRKFANLNYFSLSMHDLTYPMSSILKDNLNSIVISLSVSGETKEVTEAVAGLDKKPNVFTYGITAGKNSSLARICDYSIEYLVEEERKNIFFDLSSQVPVVLILETVFGYVYQYKLEKINEVFN